MDKGAGTEPRFQRLGHLIITHLGLCPRLGVNQRLWRENSQLFKSEKAIDEIGKWARILRPVDLPLKAGANRWTFCFQWETGELFYRWRLSSSWELWLFARRIKSQLK